MRASANEKECVMSLPSKIFACLLVATPVGLAGTASAAPMGAPLALHAAAGAPVETVQWRGHWGGWRGGRGWGWGGLAAGAIVGSALAASGPWYGYDYDYAPGYYSSSDPGYYGYSYDPGYSYAPAPGYSYGPAPGNYNYGYSYSPGYNSYGYSPGQRDAAYCTQRYRSYDPSSGTYLGYDGIRHPCP
jgi:hypothetical protein